MNLTGKNFLKLLDFTPEEITYLIDLSAELKNLIRLKSTLQTELKNGTKKPV